MSIITFYSYKGGVGRSLALANVAVQLAKSGGRVLVIDWDLEAPGLEDYFEEFQVEADGRGLLFLLRDQDFLGKHLWRLTAPDEKTKLDFLPSGRDEPDYYPTLERFDQDQFFATGGGDFLEKIRAEWFERYDYVLIDSRTGLSDAGGICTIFLPDIVVGMFTASRQSFRGVRDVLTLARASRQKLAYTRPHFSVIPVPCRLNASDEGDVERWMIEFADAMGELTEDWRPRTLLAHTVLNALRIDHAGALAHGTKIIKESFPEVPAQALSAYHRIAHLLQSDLQDLSQLVRSESGYAKTEGLTKQVSEWERSERKFRYDFYFSVAGGSIESRWVEEAFLPKFTAHISANLGRAPRIFFDRHEISAVQSFAKEIMVAITHSRIMLIFFTARTIRSDRAHTEFDYFRAENPAGLIVPIRLSSAELPKEIRKYVGVDFQEYFVTSVTSAFSESERGLEFEIAVRDLARDLAKHLTL